MQHGFKVPVPCPFYPPYADQRQIDYSLSDIIVGQESLPCPQILGAKDPGELEGWRRIGQPKHRKVRKNERTHFQGNYSIESQRKRDANIFSISQ